MEIDKKCHDITLEQLGFTRMVEPLTVLLTNRDEQVRLAAVEALAKLESR